LVVFRFFFVSVGKQITEKMSYLNSGRIISAMCGTYTEAFAPRAPDNTIMFVLLFRNRIFFFFVRKVNGELILYEGKRSHGRIPVMQRIQVPI
jgi:hypothetical protein